MTTITSLTTLVSHYLPVIERQLAAAINFKMPDTRKTLENAMQYSMTPKAKRIRPMLALATQLLFSKTIKPIIPVAVAIELMHTYSLIHDDLPAMDNDTYRRGQLTCHKQFDEATAILAGDTLNTYAFEILTRQLPKCYPAEQILSATAALAHACGINGMTGGQMMDLKSPDHSDFKYLFAMHRLKTGALITASLEIPAILNQAPQGTQKIIKSLGNHLGILFQIADDILDVTGTIKTLGKTAKKDYDQNKLTYVRFFGLEEAKNKLYQEADAAQAQLKKLKNHDTRLFNNFITYFTERDY